MLSLRSVLEGRSTPALRRDFRAPFQIRVIIANAKQEENEPMAEHSCFFSLGEMMSSSTADWKRVAVEFQRGIPIGNFDR